MNRLVEEIIKPILEADSKITKVVGIFGGRFQPFGPHHKKVYEWLSKQFDDAYITTSNIKKLPRHPMNFKEKVRHMTKMGIPKSKIIQEKTPFVAKRLEKKFNSKPTAFVYIFGKKDTGRLGGGKYFQDYKKNKNNLKGFEEHGYYLVAPHMSVSAGGLEVSGTGMRNLLGSDKYDDNERKKLFKKMFGYFNDGIYQMMTNKFKKIFEAELEFEPKSMYYVPSRRKKLKKKWDDGKDMELLKGWIEEDWFKKGSKKDRELKLKISKLYSKAFKMMPGSPNQKKIQKEIEKLRNQLSEGVDLPIEIGDTIRMGRFKNKKVVVKSLEWNEKGDLLINGRPALKFRVEPKPNIFDEFLIYTDMNKLIKEATTVALSGLQAVDSGPNMFMKGIGGYTGRNKEQAEKLGWEVIDYILDVDVKDVPPLKDEFTNDRNPVSFFPAGIGTGITANNPENLTGAKAYNKWVKVIKSIATSVGFELLQFLEPDEKESAIDDSSDTIKQQKEEEKEQDKEIKDVKVEESFSKEWWKENLLTEGGAYGHMAHPFDDKDLTFGDLKQIIENGLGGQLSREDNVTEKLDGQNIMISWKDGKLIAARNKGHIKNGGKTALDTKGIISKFKGRGDIADAFSFAMKDLERALKSLSQKQKDKIFNNGHNFMNLEVMWPKSSNVINYDKAELVFHGALIYDDKANVKGEVKGSGRILAGMIQQRNQNIQKKYKIGKPVFLTVPKHQDFGKMKSKFLGKLNKLQSKFGLSDNDTLGLYHQKWWEQFITKQLKKISPKVLEGLVKRWAFFDKSYKIPQIKQDLKDEPIFLEWVLKTDKENHAKIVKENMKPFEELFFGVGAEILKNVKGFMAANPTKAVQGIRKKLDKAISNVRSGGDLKKLNTLRLQLDKLNAIGGTKAIVPSEGIVFKYKGKTYKFTGAFAPINQITGLISF